MERTVRKNSREFSLAIAAATDVRIYSLDNCFSGAPVEEFPKWVDDFKLYSSGDRYKARVHSNLWVEFKVAA